MWKLLAQPPGRCMKTKEACEKPSCFDDFLVLSSSNIPYIAHKEHWTKFSRTWF
jgi:hypothetical protein